jgi:hypothetical protein
MAVKYVLGASYQKMVVLFPKYKVPWQILFPVENVALSVSS